MKKTVCVLKGSFRENKKCFRFPLTQPGNGRMILDELSVVRLFI